MTMMAMANSNPPKFPSSSEVDFRNAASLIPSYCSESTAQHSILPCTEIDTEAVSKLNATVIALDTDRLLMASMDIPKPPFLQGTYIDSSSRKVLQNISQNLNGIQQDAKAIKGNVDVLLQSETSWDISRNLQGLLDGIIWRHLLLPVGNYENIVVFIKGYIYEVAGQLDIPLYRRNGSVFQVKVDGYIEGQMPAMKREFINKIFSSISTPTKLSLSQFVHGMVFDNYSLQSIHPEMMTRTGPVSHDLMIMLAWARVIAVPFALMESLQDRNDYFWTSMQLRQREPLALWESQKLDIKTQRQRWLIFGEHILNEEARSG